MTAHDAAPTDIQQSAVYNTLPPSLPWLRYETSRGLITGGGGANCRAIAVWCHEAAERGRLRRRKLLIVTARPLTAP